MENREGELIGVEKWDCRNVNLSHILQINERREMRTELERSVCDVARRS